MTDVNEEIVKAYYEAQGYMVKTNHYYIKRTPSEGSKKSGAGASDIDLIILHPIRNDRAIISVKGWHNDIVSKRNIENKWEKKDEQKLKIDKQTILAAKDFLGNTNFRKILVLPCIDTEHFKELKKELEDHYSYDEVLDFPTILSDMIRGNDDKKIPSFNDGRYYKDSEFLQTLRLLIKYYIKTN